jgi:hypothetical protein
MLSYSLQINLIHGFAGASGTIGLIGPRANLEASEPPTAFLLSPPKDCPIRPVPSRLLEPASQHERLGSLVSAQR